MHKLTVLPNGVRVVTQQRPVKMATVVVFANVGAGNEEEHENGLSHFLEHMAFKGTTTRSAKDITEEVEMLGSDINAYTSRSTTAYIVTGLGDNVGVATDVLADVIQNSIMDSGEITKEQEVVYQEITEKQDDIGGVAFDLFMKTAYPNHAIGRSILGTEEHVRSFDAKALNNYIDKHYHAANIVVACVGDVDHDTFLSQVSEKFGTIPTSDMAEMEFPEYEGGSTVFVDDTYEQAHVFIGFEAPSARDDDGKGYIKSGILANVLGGGMSSPLFQEVRENRGLCYSVSSHNMAVNGDASLFMITGSTTPKHLNEFISVSIAQLRDIADGNISDTDFVRTVNTIRREIAQSEESNMGLARSMSSDLFIFGRIRSTEEVMADVRGITKDDIIDMAKKLVNSTPTLVVAGNVDEKEDYLALVK